MGNFDNFTQPRRYEITMLSGETGKSATKEIEATSFMDVELQKSGFMRQGHTVYNSREITETKGR